MKTSILSLTVYASLLTGCASHAAAPTAAVSPTRSPATSQCAQAASLRQQGAQQLANLDLPGARTAYLKALELDPSNSETLDQLDIIDAAMDGKQVGVGRSNNVRYSDPYASPCEPKASVAPTAKGPRLVASQKPVRVIDDQNQIIMSAANRDATSDDLGRSDIARAIAMSKSSIIACYGEAPALSRHQLVELKFTVTKNGQIVRIHADASGLDNDDLRLCLENSVSKVSFHRPVAAREVSVIAPVMVVPAI